VPFGARTVKVSATQIFLARKALSVDYHAANRRSVHGFRLSPRDAAELVRAAVEAGCVKFTVANGISANRYLAADLEETMQQLGYRPADDAWASR